MVIGAPSPPCDLDAVYPGDTARAAAAARHESAHLLAAHLPGRELGGATADPNGGRARVGLLREDAGDVGLEEVLDDLVILTIGGEADRRSFPRCPGDGDDAERAWALASARTETRDEAEALVDFARAKARTLLDRQWIVALIERLSAALLEAGALSGADVQAILEGGNSNGQQET
jgi:hypothetical protein